jgi:hypothetical protein
MPVLPNAPLPGNTLNGSLGQQIGQQIKSNLLGSVGLSQAYGRKNVAEMFNYSQRTVGPSPRFIYPDAGIDWRVRLSLPQAADYFYKDPQNTLLTPLVADSSLQSDSAPAGLLGKVLGFGSTARIGVVFPYTPQLQITHSANYEAQKLTHSNYAQYFYNNSEVQSITLNADFTVQNINEGQYLLACIYFFRSVTKMFFGRDPNAGNPPPMLYLNGYGQYYLPNVPVVVTGFTHTMPAEVDYMDIPEPAVTATNYPTSQSRRLNSTRLPTTSAINITLQPVYSRTAQSRAFSLNDFAAGALINPRDTANQATAFGATQASRYANNNLKNGGFL